MTVERRAHERDFDAKGVVPCAQGRGDFNFVHGEFVSASATMSGRGIDTDWRIENGLHDIHVDDQRYESPDILVFGD